MGDEQHRTWRSDRPLDLHRTLSTLRRGPGDPAYRRAGPDVWRTTRAESGPLTVRLRQIDAHTVEAVAWGPGAQEHLDLLPRLLDGPSAVDVPPGHPTVDDARRRFPGLRVPSTGRLTDALVAAIIEQKVLGADAFASWRRLVTAHGSPAPGPAPEGMRVPPEIHTWAALPSWEWHLAGVDPKRYRTAQAATRLGASVERLAEAPVEQLHRGLQSIPGIGRWTSAEVASRVVGDADAVPWGDYHLGRLVGTALLGEIVEHDDPRVVEALEPFRPYRFLVVRLLQLSPHVRVERRGPRMSRIDYRSI